MLIIKYNQHKRNTTALGTSREGFLRVSLSQEVKHRVTHTRKEGRETGEKGEKAEKKWKDDEAITVK